MSLGRPTDIGLQLGKACVSPRIQKGRGKDFKKGHFLHVYVNKKGFLRVNFNKKGIFSSPVRSTRRAIVVTPVVHVCVCVCVCVPVPVTLC